MKYYNASSSAVKWHNTNSAKLSKNFTAREFDPNGRYERVPVHPDLVRGLQELRDKFGRAIVITSGYRAPSHNAATEGAAEGSLHQYGLAADIVVQGVEHELVARQALSIFGGVGLYNSHVHVDVGPVRYWIASGVPHEKRTMFQQMAGTRTGGTSPWGGFFQRWLDNVVGVFKAPVESVERVFDATERATRGVVEAVGIVGDDLPKVTRALTWTLIIGVPAVGVVAVKSAASGGSLMQPFQPPKSANYRPKKRKKKYRKRR